ncbi:RNA polymerase II-associated 2 [Hyphodiscus hymeniophilus]|uniref:RNA polymerase II subunit B1 CTD phosphatase RPAP2 homolog n=1 Tax=Hyphodiscus hymeniophilus TaxID=353542 RepID=A0A9P6VSX9_9HELO|nr:RNA polymerase II-associated 2 [Hyphodiscus hymeniophilus]
MAAPKSILKKTSYPATTSRSKDERDREVALYHANLLQERKDIELKILLNTETLIDYPLASKPYDASNPSPVDARSFKKLVQPFQPSDYDSLIVERNINEHCGYSLCPNDRVKDGAAGKYRLIGKTGKAKNFKVVEKGELEKWCSSACAKRALYVRVQLSQVPAWERDITYGMEIDLLDESKSGEDPTVERHEKMDSFTPDDPGKKNATDLALERGDKGVGAKKGLVDVDIKEKDVQRPAQAPSFETEDISERLESLHLQLEGHTTVFGSKRQRRHHEELEGIDEDGYCSDTDWKLD